MVSLGHNFNSRSGAQFFNEMDDQILLSAESDNNFKRLKTVPPFSIHLLISTAISICGIILACVWQDQDRCKAYFIMLYLRAMFWIITFFFDHIVKHHHEQLRLNGYHEFYRSTQVHKSVPLLIVSLWNTTILAIQSLIQHYYGPHFGEICIKNFFSPLVYVTMFTCLENIVFLFIHGTYICRVLNFNKNQLQPDALKNIQQHQNTGHVGLMQRDSGFTDLLEKQGDLINYLKDHNLKLNQKLMQLNAQMQRNSQQL